MHMASPEPAAVRALIDAGEEALFVVAVDALADERVTVVIPALVVDVAPAAACDVTCAAIYRALTHHIESLAEGRMTDAHQRRLHRAFHAASGPHDGDPARGPDLPAAQPGAGVRPPPHDPVAP